MNGSKNEFGNLDLQEYRPELLSRRGEALAWGSALLVVAAWIVLGVSGRSAPAAVPVLAVFLLLAALGISLSNWMDRQTRILIDPHGITFHNGLRHTHLVWPQIRQVQVFPSPWGRKVEIVGPDSHFSFRTMGEVKVQGDVKGRMGFKQGESILKLILERAHLKQIEHPGSGYYYAPE
jgi:hypothetical protein